MARYEGAVGEERIEPALRGWIMPVLHTREIAGYCPSTVEASRLISLDISMIVWYILDVEEAQQADSGDLLVD